jgi:hypothetical protein
MLRLFRRSHIKLNRSEDGLLHLSCILEYLCTPTPLAMRKILDIYDRYVNEYSIKFNANKSKCLYFHRASCSHQADSKQKSFHYTEYVDSWPHLGHYKINFSDDLDTSSYRKFSTN